MNITLDGRSERIFATTGSWSPVFGNTAFCVLSRQADHAFQIESVGGNACRPGVECAPVSGGFAFKVLPFGGRDGLWISAHLDEESPHFRRAWAIYQEAFLDFERRSPDEQRAAMSHPRYRFSAVMRDGEVVGLIGWWDMDDFLFVEHFAIDPALRSGGLGRLTLEALQSHAQMPVVVDVEPFGADLAAARRVAFYRRQGFHYCGVPVRLPPYRGKAVAESNFMAWPFAMDAQDRARCFAAIRAIVYRV